MDDLISIVIPTRDRAQLVGRALKSIQGQDYENWEALVIDDGSGDDTSAVLAELAATDPRIRFIPQARRGAQAARNRGIEAARGEWITFLDSDDYLLPGSLRVRKEAAERARVDFVHSDALVITDHRTESERLGVPRIEGHGFSRLLSGPGPVFPAIFVRRHLLDRVGPLDEKVAAWQEWDLSIRLARHSSIAFVTEPTFVYDRTTTDSVSRDDTQTARGYSRIVWKHVALIVARAGPGALARHFRTVATLNARCGRWVRSACYHAGALAVAVFSPSLVRDRIRRHFGVR